MSQDEVSGGVGGSFAFALAGATHVSRVLLILLQNKWSA